MDSPNRALLVAVAERLGDLRDQVVFVGGHVTELLITDPAMIRVRPTDDVDVIVEVAGSVAFHRLEQGVARCGFRRDTRENAPLCRWVADEDLTLDLMPVDPRVLGFSNAWYGAAVRHVTDHELEQGLIIRIPEAPIFLATKLAAFVGRGEGDLLGSHDLEDVISLVSGRAELADEVRAAPPDLRSWVSERVAALLLDPDFDYAIQGALPDAASIPAYTGRVRDRFVSLRD